VRGRVKGKHTPLEGRRVTDEPFAFAARQADPDFKAWLDLFIRKLRTSGDFHKMAARYNAWFRAER
jgi:ABC-type amino acid transport substrate-binding protein